MLRLYEPSLEELWFREELLADRDTMRYNEAWGGTIPFPRERWNAWHRKWIGNGDRDFFYRYLKDDGIGFVGETAFHRDTERGIFLADVIVHARSRHRGFGREGLLLLTDEARRRGIGILYDEIAADNPAIGLFLSLGFTVQERTGEAILLRKDL